MTSTSSYARVRACVVLFLFSIALLHPAQAFAQGGTVAISGTVKDASGGVVTGAVVETVVADRAVAITESSEKGQFRVEVPSGVPFELRVRHQGFADYAADMSGVNAAATRDVTLQVGGVSDTLVVTASRGAESRRDVTSSVTVATADDMHAIGASQLTDVLRFVPGVAVEGTGREGAVTSLFARGGDSDYNVVLIDGVRANLDGGRFDFSRIAVGEIERVEVVRGPQSSLWGADAMGSVVQVFTRRAGADDTLRASGSVEGGSFGTLRGNTHLTGGARRAIDYQAGVAYRKTDGAFEDLLDVPDWFEQTGFDGAVGARLGSRASVRSGVRFSHGQGRLTGPITYGARTSSGAYDTKDLTWYANSSHTVGSRFTGTATVNYFRYSSVVADDLVNAPYSTYTILAGTPNAIYPNGTRLIRLIDQAEFAALSAAGALPAPGQFLASATTSEFGTFTSRSAFRRPAVKYQGDLAWRTGQRLTAGYDWERETNPNVSGFDLDNNAFFIQHQSTFADRWFVTLGARVDSKESYDTFFSPKLSLGGFLVPVRAGGLSSLKAVGNVGRGVKSPTFGERFGSAFADPNPDIKPEKAESWDLGAEATFADERFRALATYFHNDFIDQISQRSPRVVGDGIPEFINIDGSRAQGWELEFALQRPFEGFTAAAMYALVDTEVVTNQSTSQQFQPGQPLLRRPKHSGTVRAAYAAGRATVNFDLRMVGQRFDSAFLGLRSVANVERPTPFNTDITINPRYAVAGLGVDFRVDRALTVYVRGNNITDTEYDSALGYPGMPRTVMVGAQFNLGRR